MHSEEPGAGWKQQGGGEIKGPHPFLHSRNKFYHTQLFPVPCCSVCCLPLSWQPQTRHMACPENSHLPPEQSPQHKGSCGTSFHISETPRILGDWRNLLTQYLHIQDQGKYK